MKITKYPQSCLLIETKGKKILVDPGDTDYKEEYFAAWNSSDLILITHKHSDHCYTPIIERMDKNKACSAFLSVICSQIKGRPRS